MADAGDDEPTVILVGKNGIALQWLDPDPEDVRSGEETVRGSATAHLHFPKFGIDLFGLRPPKRWGLGCVSPV